MRSVRVLSAFWVNGHPAVAFHGPAPAIDSTVLRPSDGAVWRVAAVEQFGPNPHITGPVLIGSAVPAEGDELEILG